MKVSRWKIFLSYFIDIPLQDLTSERNGHMRVTLSRGAYKLITDNAVYSFGKNYRSFAYAFEMLDVHEDDTIESVLVLGWGIGSIADLLDKHPGIRKITGVEHDGTLIDFYRRIEQPGLSFTVDLLQMDATEYTSKSEEKFDLVCSDIFIDNKTPGEIISQKYLKDLSGLLKPGGLCLLSKLNVSMADREQNLELETNLKAIGADYKVVNTIGNRMYHWKALLE